MVIRPEAIYAINALMVGSMATHEHPTDLSFSQVRPFMPAMFQDVVCAVFCCQKSYEKNEHDPVPAEERFAGNSSPSVGKISDFELEELPKPLLALSDDLPQSVISADFASCIRSIWLSFKSEQHTRAYLDSLPLLPELTHVKCDAIPYVEGSFEGCRTSFLHFFERNAKSIKYLEVSCPSYVEHKEFGFVEMTCDLVDPLVTLERLQALKIEMPNIPLAILRTIPLLCELRYIHLHCEVFDTCNVSIAAPNAVVFEFVELTHYNARAVLDISMMSKLKVMSINSHRRVVVASHMGSMERMSLSRFLMWLF